MNYNFYKSSKELKKMSIETLNGSWKNATKVSIINILFFILGAILSALPYLIGKSIVFTVIVSLVCAFVLYIINFGWKVYCWNLVSQKNGKTSNLLSGFTIYFVKLVGAMFKKFFLQLAWLVVLIFPAFSKWLSYDMYEYILIDDSRDVKDPINESKHLMKDNVLRLFGFYLSFAGWFVLAVITFGIGFVWLMPYFSVAKTHFYENLKTEF